jgi:AI-2 transport protein TqsA
MKRISPSPGPPAWSVILVALILVVLLLHWSQPVTAPLAYALLLIAAASPLQRWLEWGVPRWLALLGTILLFAAVLGLLVAVFAYAASAVIDGIGQHGAHIERTYRAAVRWAEEQGVAASAPLAEQIDMARLLAVAQAAIGGIHVVLAFVALTVVFLVLGLIEADDFRAKVREGWAGAEGEKILWAVDEIGRKFRRYLLVRTFVSVLTGVLTWGFALLVGLQFATLWGLLAFVLNYIPFIGSVIAVIPPVLFAIAQFQSWQAALLVLGGLGAIQFTIGNYIDPRLEGRALAISPLVVVVSIFFWALVWGVPGAFIGVPMTIALITFCEPFERTRWIAHLLGSRRHLPAPGLVGDEGEPAPRSAAAERRPH